MKKLLLLVLPFMILSCSSDSSSSSDNSAMAYVRGNKDGTAFNYTATTTSTDYGYNYYSGYSALDSFRWYSYGGMVYTSTFTPSFNIYWSNMVATDNPATETATFYNEFATVPTNYLTNQQMNDDYLKGVSIQYESATGDYYESIYGSQVGSTFTVSDKVEAIDPATGLQTITITGTFSCKLYNSDDTSDVINITNGTYKIVNYEYN